MTESRKGKRARKLERHIEDQRAVLNLRGRVASWRSEAGVLREIQQPTSVLIERARTLESVAQEVEDVLDGRKTG